MGSACSCFHVKDPEDISSSSNGNCICPSCFIHNLFSKYPSAFSSKQMQTPPSSNQGAASFTANVEPENTEADTTTSPPTRMLYDADSRYSNLEQDLVVTRHEKGAGRLPKDLEQLRSVHLGPELVSGGDNPEQSSEKLATGVGYDYASSEDEDVCPTCLEEYTPENPKIITKCSHNYHLSCIYEWMERSESCPVCGKIMLFDETT